MREGTQALPHKVHRERNAICSIAESRKGQCRIRFIYREIPRILTPWSLAVSVSCTHHQPKLQAACPAHRPTLYFAGPCPICYSCPPAVVLPATSSAVPYCSIASWSTAPTPFLRPLRSLGTTGRSKINTW